MIEPGKEIFKDYILKKHIGEGGFGRVYLVKSKIGKAFALKILFKGAVGEKRGVESVIKIRSNRLVNVLDFGETVDGDFCVLMEYVRDTFAPVLEKKLEEKTARHYFREILEGLKVLEKNNIIHRDIKPSNLFIHEQLVKIGDFGTAKYTSGETSTKTRLLGTIKYCAPECFQNYFAFSVDQWAASVIFYRMLTGKFPFEGDNYAAIMGALMMKAPDLSIVPEKYVPFFQLCFEKETGNRFSDTQEMIRAFDKTESVQQNIQEYETRIKVLEGQLEQAKEQLDKPRIQGDYIKIEGGRDVSLAKDQAEIAIADSSLEIAELRKEIERLKAQNNGQAGKTVAQGNNLQGVIQAGTVQKVEQHFHAAPGSDGAKVVPEKQKERTPDKAKPVKKPVAKKPESEAPPAETKPVTESNAQEIERDGSRFIAKNDGTVSDTKTGLMWAAKDNGYPINWQDAKKYCKAYRGDNEYSNWRLPTIRELEELYKAKTKSIKLTSPHQWIWSSEIKKDGSLAARFTFMMGGCYWDDCPDYSTSRRVLPVRGGNLKMSVDEQKTLTPDSLKPIKKPVSKGPLVKASPAETKPVSESKAHEIKRDGRFIAYNNGTVLDENTGLMWAEKDNGKDIKWKDAKRYCESYRGGEHSDWRLPTLDELEWLYVAKIKLIKITRVFFVWKWVWSSEFKETKDGSRVAYFTFGTGGRYWLHPDDYNRSVLPVREGNFKKKVDQPTPDKPKKVKEKLNSFGSGSISGKKNRLRVLSILISILVVLGLVWWKMPKIDEEKPITITKKPKSVTTSTMPGVKPGVKEIVRDGHFIAYDDGTVLDEKTGLMWAVEDNGQDIDWKNAKLYCEEYQGGGYSDWRLPTIKDLKGLYDAGIRKPQEGIISISGWGVWSSETSGSSAAYFNFDDGNEYQSTQSDSNDYRVLPVRGRN
ncbi:DUF1566 domain-containing protein [Desulfobacterales bacterium HSG16]|nr:DUF1566 domain-containing protein [Desulfobacterales bacterium HSG16]